MADIHNLFLEDKKLLEQILDFYWYIIKRQWHLYANSIQGVPKKGTFKFLLIVPLLLSTSDFARWQQQERDMSRQPREILKVTFFGTPCTSVRNNSSFEDGVDHQFCDSACNYQDPESFPSSITPILRMESVIQFSA